MRREQLEKRMEWSVEPWDIRKTEFLVWLDVSGEEISTWDGTLEFDGLPVGIYWKDGSRAECVEFWLSEEGGMDLEDLEIFLKDWLDEYNEK